MTAQMVASTLSLPEKVLLGHRGTSVMAPENTLPAFDFALQHGADALETDVRLSRDGEVLVIHDAAPDRTSNGSGLIRELTRSEIEQFDAGYRFQRDGEYSHRGQGVRFITLARLFEQYPNTPINIDIKDNLIEAADAVLQVVQDCNALERTVLASFHHPVVVHVRRRLPQIATSATVRDVFRFYFEHLVNRRQHSPPVFEYFQLPPRHGPLSLHSRRFVDSVHRRGRHIHYWTINSVEEAQKLLDQGADGIVTDRVDLIAPLFGKVS